MKTLFYIDNSGSIEGKTAYHNITKKEFDELSKIKGGLPYYFFKFQLFYYFILSIIFDINSI